MPPSPPSSRHGKQPAEDAGEEEGAAAQRDEGLDGGEGLDAALAAALGGDGDGGVWVEARASCPHASDAAETAPRGLPRFDAPCARCSDGAENWVCLSCCRVLCGRFVNGHMRQHAGESGHPLALSFRDLSVWCFACDSYIDAQLVSQLRPLYEAYHLMKFGTKAPPRTMEGRTIDLG
eukprot:SM000034S12718  [mRNA]  locus=s34:329394:330217:- [translate_table: standard]